ncbi:MAG: hypothetical protein K0R76_1609 [Alphaproteobacteria bacterium]|jgi:cytochrome b pre-mRNA-processing protein 3|nr:hypothetical protein [Alphaproteobacteria bacterium]
MMEMMKKKKPFATPLTAELYRAVTCQARQFIFFQDYQVPDTPQGRFEMLALHLALMLRRLKVAEAVELEEYPNLTQDLCNWIVADVEESLRAMRISELKMTRHLKGFMEGFYGRLVAYDKALELNDKGMLEQAIRRNVYGIVNTIEDDIIEGLMTYTRQTWAWLQETSIPQIIMDLTGD